MHNRTASNASASASAPATAMPSDQQQQQQQQQPPPVLPSALAASRAGITGSNIRSPLRNVSLARRQSAPIPQAHALPAPALAPAAPSARSSTARRGPSATGSETGDRASIISSQLSDISTSDEEPDDDERAAAAGVAAPRYQPRSGSGQPASMYPSPGAGQGHSAEPSQRIRAASHQGQPRQGLIVTTPDMGGSQTPLLSGAAPPPLPRTRSSARYPSLGPGPGGAGGPASRSASRVRAPAPARDSDREDGGDDEVPVRDRGEDLIRKRMQERKRAKRLAEREQQRLGPGVAAGQDSASGGPGGAGGAAAGCMSEAGTYGAPSVPPTPRMERPGGAGPAGVYAHSPRLPPGVQEPGPRSTSSSRAASRNRGGAGAERRDPSAGYFPAYVGDGAASAAAGTGRAQGASHSSGYLTADDLIEHDQDLGDGEDAGPDTPGGTCGASPRLGENAHGNGDSRAGSVVDEVVGEVVREAQEERGDGEDDDDEDEEGSDASPDVDEEGVTLRDRQDAINIEHPFGLPIWKPALYRKSRSITRNADIALHAIPSAAAERHLLPGNILWTLIFGWWLSLVCFLIAGIVFLGEVLSGGRGAYARTLYGLGWYVGWPFGKYVSGDGGPKKKKKPTEEQAARDALDFDQGSIGEAAVPWEPTRVPSESTGSLRTIRDLRGDDADNAHSNGETVVGSGSSPESKNDAKDKAVLAKDYAAESLEPANERQGLTRTASHRSYGTTNGKQAVDEDDAEDALASEDSDGSAPNSATSRAIGSILYWPLICLVIGPLLLVVCILCWGMVITIPMAKLTWTLLRYLLTRPLEIHFRSAPKVAVPSPTGSPSAVPAGDGAELSASSYTVRRARLKAGQLAPSAGEDDAATTVLLCIYRAVGLQYYKYTIGGVNIMFVNLVPLVFFTIFDAFVLLPIADRSIHLHGLFALITSRIFIFILSLASVIPLSYFIGMAVASISAQSSIGMGAVINATFGSVIEVILYGIALTQGKGRLVEGSIVGSILAGVLLMPGASMVSGAFKRKEQRFNAKSAGVTSTMLIMAIIGTLTPTLFYQTYGSFQLRCEGCPDVPDSILASDHITGLAVAVGGGTNEPWKCQSCYYDHPDPTQDPFYQDQVKTLMYLCASILLLSYLIGLWFSLKTHASQIWQNPQQLMKADELAQGAAMHPAHRASMYNRLTPQAVMQQLLPQHRQPDQRDGSLTRGDRRDNGDSGRPERHLAFASPMHKVSFDPQRSMRERSMPWGTGSVLATPTGEGAPPLTAKTTAPLTPMRLPANLTTEDFTRAVAVATVSALRQHAAAGPHGSMRIKPVSGQDVQIAEEDHGGHEGPSWSRATSTAVLLSCTVLYALIAEILVDVVDVVLDGSGIDEKFLGVTLFALVPNTTEFMNAMSFALNGNIALSMEIGSAYALQVCLLQIPAMVAFSAFWDPQRLGQMVDTFTLIFPRWDVVAIILSIFLLTYTYIEARSNYHRGSILILSYLVLTAGFYFAPSATSDGETVIFPDPDGTGNFTAGQFAVLASKLWA